MRAVGKLLAYLLLFMFFLVIFLPKKELYYQAEHLLQKERIVVSNEKLHESLFWLDVEAGNLYIQNIPIGSFEKARLYPDIFINALHLENFRTDGSSPIFPKVRVKTLFIFYTPFYPVKLFIKGQTSFGKISGWVDLKAKRGTIDIFGTPKELMRYLPLTKVKEGHYRYAFSY